MVRVVRLISFFFLFSLTSHVAHAENGKCLRRVQQRCVVYSPAVANCALGSTRSVTVTFYNGAVGEQCQVCDNDAHGVATWFHANDQSLCAAKPVYPSAQALPSTEPILDLPPVPPTHAASPFTPIAPGTPSVPSAHVPSPLTPIAPGTPSVPSAHVPSPLTPIAPATPSVPSTTVPLIPALPPTPSSVPKGPNPTGKGSTIPAKKPVENRPTAASREEMAPPSDGNPYCSSYRDTRVVTEAFEGLDQERCHICWPSLTANRTQILIWVQATSQRICGRPLKVFEPKVEKPSSVANLPVPNGHVVKVSSLAEAGTRTVPSVLASTAKPSGLNPIQFRNQSLRAMKFLISLKAKFDLAAKQGRTLVATGSVASTPETLPSTHEATVTPKPATVPASAGHPVVQDESVSMVDLDKRIRALRESLKLWNGLDRDAKELKINRWGEVHFADPQDALGELPDYFFATDGSLRVVEFRVDQDGKLHVKDARAAKPEKFDAVSMKKLREELLKKTPEKAISEKGLIEITRSIYDDLGGNRAEVEHSKMPVGFEMGSKQVDAWNNSKYAIWAELNMLEQARGALIQSRLWNLKF